MQGSDTGKYPSNVQIRMEAHQELHFFEQKKNKKNQLEIRSAFRSREARGQEKQYCQMKASFH